MLFHIFQKHIDAILDELTEAGVLPVGMDRSNVTVEPPRDPSHGDLSTNAAMVLSKAAGMKPRDLAEKIADKIRGRQPEPRSTADYYVAGDAPVRGKPLREVSRTAQ